MSARLEAELREAARIFYESTKDRLPAGVLCAVVFSREERGGVTIVVGGDEALAVQVEECLEGMAAAVDAIEKKPGSRRDRRG